MWIMTSFGPLYPSARPAKYIPEGDNRTIQVRARRREYLDHYRANYDPTAGEVLDGKQRTGRAMDYPYAVYTTPEALAAAVLKISNEIVEDQMTKFKPTTTGKRGLKDSKLANQVHSLYMSLWSRQLDVSDGTSSYDPGNWKTNYAGAYTAAVEIRKSGKNKGKVIDTPNPKMCEQLSHWYPRNWKAAGLADSNTCFDCGHKRPEPKKWSDYKPTAASTGKPWTPSQWDDNAKVTGITRSIPAGAVPTAANCGSGVHWFPMNWEQVGIEPDTCFDCGHKRDSSEQGDDGEVPNVTSHLQLLQVPGSNTTTDAGGFLNGLA